MSKITIFFNKKFNNKTVNHKINLNNFVVTKDYQLILFLHLQETENMTQWLWIIIHWLKVQIINLLLKILCNQKVKEVVPNQLIEKTVRIWNQI